MVASSNSLTTEEPCCPKCGYSLRGLSELRCPECGTPFAKEFVRDFGARIHLLQWERPEVGRQPRRLIRTILQASLHPGRFFSALSQRKDRPVENAGSFIVACVIASISLYITATVLQYFVFFLRATWRWGDPLLALNTLGKLVQSISSSWWFIPSSLILSMVLSVFLIAVLLARVFRSRCGTLRAMDLAAVFSPAVTFGAFIHACVDVVMAIAQYNSFLVLVSVAVWAQTGVLILLVWHFCRRLLVLSRGKTVATVIVCGIMHYGCQMLVFLAARQILLANFP